MPVSVPSLQSTPLHAPAGFLPWVAELVHQHRARLLSYARRRGLDPEESLDAVQDSFLSFLRLPEARTIGTDPEDSLKFLTVILRHNLGNQRRKRVRRERAHALLEAQLAAQDVESSEALISRAEETARVNGCILQMARLQRSVVTLSLVDDRPHEVVAQMLGISQGYVRVLLHRARQHLRTCSHGAADRTSEED